MRQSMMMMSRTCSAGTSPRNSGWRRRHDSTLPVQGSREWQASLLFVCSMSCMPQNRDGKLPIPAAPSLQLRLGEKRILRGTMDGVRRRLAPIRGIPTKVMGG